jgi:F0F1-type ATP synthase membrane subunit b/b'
VTDRARTEAGAVLDEAKARIASETEAARVQLLPQAHELAGEIADSLLGRRVGG